MSTLSSYHLPHFYYSIVIKICLFLAYGSIRFEMYRLVTVIPTVKMWEQHSFMLTQRKWKLPGVLSPRNHLLVYRAKDDLELLIPLPPILELWNYRWETPHVVYAVLRGQTRGFVLHKFLTNTSSPKYIQPLESGFSPWQMDSRVAHKGTDIKSLLLLIAN